MAEDNATKILDLAVAAIDSGGEAAVRVNHIVAEVGVTPPVIYYHFGSRDGLVIAAQIERYSRMIKVDTETLQTEVKACESREDLRAVLRATWRKLITERTDARWRRTNVLGSAYARPELAAAIAATQDRIIVELLEIVKPCLAKGWFREGIDLESAVAWQHSIVWARVLVEQGEERVDRDEWDRLTLEAVERAFFGDAW